VARIGLVLHPTRDCTAAVGQVAEWADGGVAELVAATADAHRERLGEVPESLEA
jgi:NAD+ kinase